MSVPKSKQHPDKQLNAIKLASDLEQYTLIVTKNTKYFPEDFCKGMRDELVRLSQAVVDNLNRANTIRPKFAEDCRLRRKLQWLALGDLNSLNTQLGIARPVFKIKGKRYKHWAGLIKSAKDGMLAWMDADMRRYESLLENKYHIQPVDSSNLPDYYP